MVPCKNNEVVKKLLTESPLDCKQSVFRFDEGSAHARAREFSHARGNLRVSRALLDRPRKKRGYSKSKTLYESS